MALPAASTRLEATKSCPLPLAPTGNVGLRRPMDRFALRSSFFSPSVHLLLPPTNNQHPALPSAAAAPKISMRVASKQAYICRDCGSVSSSLCFVHDQEVSTTLVLNIDVILWMQIYLQRQNSI